MQENQMTAKVYEAPQILHMTDRKVRTVGVNIFKALIQYVLIVKLNASTSQ